MPTFLADILGRKPLDFSRIDISAAELGNYEPSSPRAVTLLYQTGYLTICASRDVGGSCLYSLDFPNREVRESFLHAIAPVYSGLGEDAAGNAQIAAITALYDHDVPKFVKALKTFFSNIPYSLTDRQNEQMWQTIVYVILRLIGVSAQGEVQTHDGRIDLVAHTPNDIYIVEFKLDRPAAEAMEQIRGKDYAGKYALSKKRITLVGISFSSEKRTIVEDIVEEFETQERGNT